MADRLNTVAVGVQHEGGKVVAVILWTQTGITVAPTTRDESRCVKGVNRRAVGSAEAQVHPAPGMASRFLAVIVNSTPNDPAIAP